MKHKIGSVENADIILKRKEKDAYLEFLEHGGYAKMRDLEMAKLEDKRRVIEHEAMQIKPFEIIRDAYQKVSKMDEYRMCFHKAKKIDSIFFRMQGKEITDYLEAINIFKKLGDYLNDKESLDNHMFKINTKLKIKKEQIETEYKNKLEKYKQKVRKSFWRKVFK